MSTKLTNSLFGLLVVISIGIGIWAYPQLPNEVASHWDVSGNVNGYMNRFWGVAFAPLLLAFMWALFTTLPTIDPMKENVAKFRPSYNALVLVFGLFIFGIGKITLLWNLGYDVPIARLAVTGIAFLSITLGVFLPRTRRNYFMGIRTPWTLASDIVWDETHRRAGHWFLGAGILSLVGALFFPVNLTLFIGFGALMFAAIASVVSSYLIFRTQQERKKS